MRRCFSRITMSLSSLTLDSPASSLVSFGDKLAAPLERLGIRTIRDLLLYAPVRHEDFRTRTTVANIKVGERAVVAGRITQIANRRSWRTHMTVTEALLEDDTGTLRLLWFRQPYILHQIRVGEEVVVSGILRTNQYGASLVAPTIEKVSRQELLHTSGLVAQYPLTKGLTHKQLRYLIHQAIPFAKDLEDWIPDNIRNQYHILPLPIAVKALHTPVDQEDQQHSERRFSFEQLFCFQCQAQYIRARTAARNAHRIAFDQLWFQQFVATLPFPLTSDQKKAVWAIIQDIGKSTPMNRLLNGDVGTGKTIVAMLAMAVVAHAGFQAVLLAPTEILALQHFQRMTDLLRHTGITIALATHAQRHIVIDGQQQVVTLSQFRKQLRHRSIQIVIGTHALLSAQMKLPSIALVIVDEQHRFGVDQRRTILAKGMEGDGSMTPHHCSMTATPIPRTLALAFFGDFDLSILQQFPQGKRRVVTELVEDASRGIIDTAIEQTVKAGKQVFVVCPLIALSTKRTRRSVISEAERLQHQFPHIRWGLLHGKMEGPDQQHILNSLLNHSLDGIIATTVVEVGIDIPDAALLVVEGAESFGLAQLHQLRGRIGRAGQTARCLLVPSEGAEAHERLEALVQTDDGWKLAEIDLRLRGPGQLIGMDQSGQSVITLAQLGNRALLEQAHDAARELIMKDPALEKYPLVKEKILMSRLVRG